VNTAGLLTRPRFEVRWWYAELHRRRGVFLASLGADNTQIEASFREAIRIAKRQKAISAIKCAEAATQNTAAKNRALWDSNPAENSTRGDIPQIYDAEQCFCVVEKIDVRNAFWILIARSSRSTFMVVWQFFESVPQN
jgi:hypothetical protein